MKIQRSTSILFFLLATSIALAQPQLPAKKVDRNVIYGMYSGLALLLDVYYPENPNGFGVIHISGSGWTKPLSLDAGLLNHQGHVKLEGAALVEAGYTVFSINHRAIPRFPYPAAVEDAQRAVRFIRYHAEKYGIDPYNIGAVGGSSGGHLVSMLGVMDGAGDPEDESPINRVSAKVQCVVARAAPTDFIEGSNGSAFLNIRTDKLGNPKSTEYKLAQEASPISYVSADDPPFLLLHGDQDDVVPFHLSERMSDALRQVGVTVKLINVKGAGHGPSFPGAIDLPDLNQARVNWLDNHLKAKSIKHSFFVAGPTFTGIIDESDNIIWDIEKPKARDGYVLPNGNILICWSNEVVEYKRDKTVQFSYKKPEQAKELGTVVRLENGNTLITELGEQPRLLEVDQQGEIVVAVPLQPETDNAHMQTRMARKLANGNYLVPHLLAFAVKEYTPKGKIVQTFETDLEELGGREAKNWPFTAIRLANGNTLINLTNGNKTVEMDANGKVVWKMSNEDVEGNPFQDPCGAQRLPNGNTVIASYGAKDGIKLFEVTPEKEIVWDYSGEHRVHHFQILTTNGEPLGGPLLK